MNNWEEGVDYPLWMTEESLTTLYRQHLKNNETPKMMFQRIIDSVKPYSVSTEVIGRWEQYFWSGWLSPATPIMANIGTGKGLPISCFIERVSDSIESIFDNAKQLALLTQGGGGVGITIDKIRGNGEPITNNGFSSGVVPFCKVYDSTVSAVSQAGGRRGAASLNLPVRHKDIEVFLNIRKAKGDLNQQCHNINHCVTIDDYFMNNLKEGDEKSRNLWAKIISTRLSTGQPYIMYYHNLHNQRPDDMVKRNLKIDGTNICTEIMLPHDDLHTVVCCLSSVNIAKYDEWKDNSDFIKDSLYFLDCIIEYFIQNAKGKPGFEKSVRFAEKSRAIGLGILGWHTYLQMNNIPFISLRTRSIINNIGKQFELGVEQYNEFCKLNNLEAPEWCDEQRNLTMFAIAPTTTTSLVQGGVSQGIEPIVSNSWIQKSANNTFIRYNNQFKHLVETKYPEYNTAEFWEDMATTHQGSVQHLDWLTELEKEVFLTAYEINQLELVNNVALWQKYIDQGISCNLFFPPGTDAKWVNKVHLNAWEKGLKSLYYVRTDSILNQYMGENSFKDCVFCEG